MMTRQCDCRFDRQFRWSAPPELATAAQRRVQLAAAAPGGAALPWSDPIEVHQAPLVCQSSLQLSKEKRLEPRRLCPSLALHKQSDSECDLRQTGSCSRALFALQQVLSAGVCLRHVRCQDGSVRAVAVAVARVGVGWRVTLQPGFGVRNLSGQPLHIHFTGPMQIPTEHTACREAGMQWHERGRSGLTVNIPRITACYGHQLLKLSHHILAQGSLPQRTAGCRQRWWWPQTR